MANQVQADGGGLRYNAGKVDFSLTPPEWEEALATVLTRGSFKYARHNWLRGMPWSTMIGCARRHLRSFQAGEKYDPESGCHHLAAAAWNILALMTYDIRGLGTDDMLDMEKGFLSMVAVDPGPELQAIIDKRRAETTKPSAPTIAPPEVEVALREALVEDREFLIKVMQSIASVDHSGCNNAAGCMHGLSRPECVHADHGRGDPDSGPVDPDCPCRGTVDEKQCADVGCGFCTAAQHLGQPPACAEPAADTDLPF